MRSGFFAFVQHFARRGESTEFEKNPESRSLTISFHMTINNLSTLAPPPVPVTARGVEEITNTAAAEWPTQRTAGAPLFNKYPKLFIVN
jgi:hypothetical protein